MVESVCVWDKAPSSPVDNHGAGFKKKKTCSMYERVVNGMHLTVAMALCCLTLAQTRHPELVE